MKAIVTKDLILADGVRFGVGDVVTVVKSNPSLNGVKRFIVTSEVEQGFFVLFDHELVILPDDKDSGNHVEVWMGCS